MTDIYFKKTRSKSERDLVAYSWYIMGSIWFLASQLYWVCDITIGPVLFLRCSFQSTRSAEGDSASNVLISPFSGTLILVRHGQTTMNYNKTFTGWIDTDLSDFGKREVSIFVHLYWFYDNYFCCPALRCLFLAQCSQAITAMAVQLLRDAWYFPDIHWYYHNIVLPNKN